MKKRVCVLGAGAAGLCSTRHALDAGHDVTAFEQQYDVGGTWLYSPDLNVFSSLYDKMNTNLPKQIMGFEHLPFETECPESFVRHQEVLAFLKRYAEPIRHLIQFNTVVNKVERKEEEWVVTVKRMDEPKEETFTFDVLFICNGHYSEPKTPSFAEKLKLPWIHSHNYRRPHAYKDKEVAVVGAGPTGVDIAMQISRYTKKIHLLHNQRYNCVMPSNVVPHMPLIDVDPNGQTLLLENGEKLDNIDEIIFCTGYRFGVPFCDDKLIEVKEDGHYLSPLYLHCVHTKYPRSLFVIGCCWLVIAFTSFDHQVRYALALVDGRAQVPSKDEMDRFEVDRLRSLEESNLPVRYFHRLVKDEQWDYFALLAKLVNRPELPKVIRGIHDFTIENIFKNTCVFKSYRFKVLNDEEFEYKALVDLDCN